MTRLYKPTKRDLEAARGKTVPDVMAPGLTVLFCGINPGLYSAAVGHHFARPGNRFWTALYASGFSRRLLAPSEERDLLKSGYGITNLVNRASANARELSKGELVKGRRRLEAKLRKYRPQCVAILGIEAYRSAFQRPHAVPGRQKGTLSGAAVWVLPNPSGLNAHYKPSDLAAKFRELLASVTAKN